MKNDLNPLPSMQSLRKTAHLLASIIFLAIAATHLGAVARDIKLLHLYNTLFPFITNGTLFSLSVALELAFAAICFRFSGRTPADGVILFFVMLMLWYRLGMHVTNPGGYTCACLGILTVILNLSKRQEQMAAYGILALLFMCALPFLGLQWNARRRGIQRSLLLASVVSLTCFHAGAATIEIKGHYQYTNYNPRDGVPIVKDGVPEADQFKFTANLAGDRWDISVASLSDSNLWSQVVYDGTNTYAFNPGQAPFAGEEGIASNAVYVTISPSAQFLPSVSDWAYSHIPWLVYGLSPAKHPPDKSGLVEIPLPWETPRLKAKAWGWNWKIVPSEDSRYMASCTVERESKLDFNTISAELLRFEMDYPESVAYKNFYIDQINYRKSMTNHFVAMEYSCTDWFSTNGFKIPAKAEAKIYQRLLSKPTVSPITRMSLVAESITVHGDTEILPPLSSARVVKDYRYKKANRSRIFKRAEYSLQAGEPWKSDHDPLLLNQVAEHLKHGPRYELYAYSFKQISVWVLGLILIGSPVILMLKEGKNKHEQKEKQ